MQRRVAAELAARQAAAVEPRPARGEAAALPVLRADAARAAAGAIPKQPEMVAAATAGTQPVSAAPHGPGTLATAAATSAPGTVDTGLDSMWNDYGDNATCASWSGGDATNSVDLGGGNRAWFFSDTFLGSPAARKTLFYSSMIHNSIVLQQGNALYTETGGNTCQETNTSKSFWDRYAITPAAAPDAGSGGFYWTDDQMVAGSNVVKFYYHGNRSVYPFAIDSWAVATIPISTLLNNTSLTITPQQYNNLCSSTGASPIIWGLALLSWGGTGDVYVYGWSTVNRTALYLAKTTATNLTNPSSWQTYAGLDSSGHPVWTDCGAQLSPLPIALGSGLSVSVINNRLWLVQQDPGSGLVGGPIAAHPAANPWSFGNSEVVLYYPPQENHTFPDYYITYGAQVEAGLASSSSYVVISYNVNSTAVDTGCVIADVHDASIYRPRFVDVPTSAFNAAAATTAAAGSATGLPAPSYGVQNFGPTDQAPSPAINAAGTVLDSAAGTGPNIDGVTDWYDQWGSLAGGCPGYYAPSTLTASPSTPDGQVTLTWPTVGTDVWFWGYQADQTAGSPFSKMWGGLWAEPSSPTAATVSEVAAPVTGPADTGAGSNGDTYAWYVQPFGAQSDSIGPVGTSPTVSEPVTIQRPAAPYNFEGSSGPAESEFNLGWIDPNYPSSALYYYLFQWDMTAGQTEQDALTGSGGPGCGTNYETCAGMFPYPLPPGTDSYHIQGWTPDNNVILVGDHEYGFAVEAANLAGPSIPTIAAVAPTPVCWAGDLAAGGSGEIKFLGGPIVYMYFGLESAYFSAGGDVLSLTDLGTNQTQEISLLPSPGEEIVPWEIGADPPITWDFNWALYSNHDVYGTATSTSC